MKTLGFIGTGTITGAIIRGIARSDLHGWPVLVSPRGHERARELSAAFPTVSIAADNQEVVDGSDLLFLAIRPQISAEVISALRFPQGQVVVSLVAGLSVNAVKKLAGGDIHVIRAIPLPSVETCSCATPIFPHHTLVAKLFDALGSTINVANEDQFAGYVAGSAVMATYFGVAKTVCDWMIANNIEASNADRYIRTLFGNLGDVLRDQKDLSLEKLQENHTTRGGLNEQVHEYFSGNGGTRALNEGLDAVLQRIGKI